MHELAVCQGLMREVERVAAENGATRVTRINLLIGALSGVEAPLLAEAYSIARAGTIAGDAALDIETVAPRVRCTACGAESDVPLNRLICAACGDWQVQVIAGEEMLLKSLELESEDEVGEDTREGSETCAQPAAAR